jgi:hypothetical protein
MIFLETCVGLFGGALLGVIGYIAVRVDQCKESLFRMEPRIRLLEEMREDEHKDWRGGRNRRSGDR